MLTHEDAFARLIEANTEFALELYEEGTEATAAAAAVVGLRSVAQPTVFRADRPFIFLIMDNATQSILFCGRVVNPGSG